MDRAQLLAAMEAAAAPKPQPVDIPAWGGTVYVRPLTVAEVDEQTGDKSDQRLARAAARVVCDAAGVRMFDPSSDADVALISRQPWAILQRILDAADKANGTSADAVAEAGNG